MQQQQPVPHTSSLNIRAALPFERSGWVFRLLQNDLIVVRRGTILSNYAVKLAPLGNMPVLCALQCLLNVILRPGSFIYTGLTREAYSIYSFCGSFMLSCSPRGLSAYRAGSTGSGALRNTRRRDRRFGFERIQSAVC